MQNDEVRPGQVRAPLSALHYWTGVGALLLVALLAFGSQRPPPAKGGSVGPEQFSAERARHELEKLPDVPRPVGSPAHERARDAIADRLRELALPVSVQADTGCARGFGQFRCAHVENIVARLKGTDGGDAIALAAHYDSVPGAPGASDDGLGVSVLLETARALRQLPQLRNDVLFLFTDAEEDFLLGATAFVRASPDRANVRALLNFDARGTGGPELLYQTSASNSLLVSAFAQAPSPVGNSFAYSIARFLPNDTDATVFDMAGIPVLAFANVEGLVHYHRASDTVSNQSPRTLQQAGDYALATTLVLGGRNLEERGGATSIYFDLFGEWLVRYPEAVGRTMSALSALLFMVAVGLSLRRWGVRGGQVLAGFFVLLAAILGAASVVAIAHRVVQYFAPSQLTLAHARLLEMAYLSLSLVMASLIYASGGRKVAPLGRALGALSLLFLLCAISAVYLPGASYLFQWTLLFGVLSSVVFASGRLSATARFWLSWALAVPGVVLFAELLAQLGGVTEAQAPEILAASIALALGVTSSFMFGQSPRGGGLVLPCAGLASIAVLTFAAVTAATDSTSLRDTSVTYGRDHETGRAYWFSQDSRVSEWSKQYLGASPPRKVMPQFSPVHGRGVLVADAEAMALPPAELTVMKDDTLGDVRTVQLRVTSPRHARCVSLWNEDGSRVEAVDIDGVPPLLITRFGEEADRKLVRELVGPIPDASVALTFCAVPDSGFTLTLRFARADHPGFVVVDESEGIPERKGARPRHSPWGPSSSGDTTRVSRRVQL